MLEGKYSSSLSATECTRLLQRKSRAARCVISCAMALRAAVYTICEEVFIAALDTRKEDIAEKCSRVLHSKFPGSLRVLGLDAMADEAAGKPAEALKKYNAIIKDDPTNMVSLVDFARPIPAMQCYTQRLPLAPPPAQHAMKRKIAVQLAMGDIAAGMQGLVDYLAINTGDLDAWLELVKLYTGAAQYKRAAFCWEEIILIAPTNPTFLCKYAEVWVCPRRTVPRAGRALRNRVLCVHADLVHDWGNRGEERAQVLCKGTILAIEKRPGSLRAHQRERGSDSCRTCWVP